MAPISELVPQEDPVPQGGSDAGPRGQGVARAQELLTSSVGGDV